MTAVTAVRGIFAKTLTKMEIDIQEFWGNFPSGARPCSSTIVPFQGANKFPSLRNCHVGSCSFQTSPRVWKSFTRLLELFWSRIADILIYSVC